MIDCAFRSSTTRVANGEVLDGQHGVSCTFDVRADSISRAEQDDLDLLTEAWHEQIKSLFPSGRHARLVFRESPFGVEGKVTLYAECADKMGMDVTPDGARLGVQLFSCSPGACVFDHDNDNCEHQATVHSVFFALSPERALSHIGLVGELLLTTAAANAAGNTVDPGFQRVWDELNAIIGEEEDDQDPQDH